MDNSAETVNKIVALTFDDGPNTTTTLEVLDKLEKYGVKASFFLIGDHINDDSINSVRRAYEMGCEIANHSKTHSDMRKFSADEVKKEIEFTSKKINEMIGEYPKFFRPPYILVNDIMIKNIELPFICGVGARDWKSEVSAQERARRALDQVSDGSIVLLHDFVDNQNTVEALDIIIPKLQEDGYRFVTVSELFKEKGITPAIHSGIVYSNALQTEKFKI